MDTVGERIRFARKKKRQTQQQLADILAVNRVSVTQWELGTTNPSVDHLTAIASSLAVPVDWLVSGGDGSEITPNEGSYSREVLAKVVKRLQGAGVLPIDEHNGNGVFEAFIEICEEERKKMFVRKADPITKLKPQHDQRQRRQISRATGT